MATLRDIETRLVQFLAAGPPVPADVDPELYQRAVLYALERHRQQGFREFARYMRYIGFAERRRGVDLGAGAGHWCLAFAHFGGHATGIEMRSEYAAVAKAAAAQLGYEASINVVTQRIEDASFPAGTFDAAWSHGVLMFCDAEPAIAKVSRWLEPDGAFYLAYTGEGMRLDLVTEGLLHGDWAAALGQQLSIMLNGYLHRLGVYHTPGGRVRMLRPEDLRTICGAYGLAYAYEPGVPERHGSFRGVPGSFDLLTTRSGSIDGTRNRLLASRLHDPQIIGELERLLQADCAGLVCDIFAADVDALSGEPCRDLYARALIRAGRGRSAEASSLLTSCTLPPLTLGLHAQDRGRFGEALTHYRQLSIRDPRRGFLEANCLLQLGDRAAARTKLRSAAEDGGELRDWIGLIAVDYQDGAFDAARDTARLLLRRLDDQVTSTAALSTQSVPS